MKVEIEIIFKAEKMFMPDRTTVQADERLKIQKTSGLRFKFHVNRFNRFNRIEFKLETRILMLNETFHCEYFLQPSSHNNILIPLSLRIEINCANVYKAFNNSTSDEAWNEIDIIRFFFVRLFVM